MVLMLHHVYFHLPKLCNVKSELFLLFQDKVLFTVPVIKILKHFHVLENSWVKRRIQLGFRSEAIM